MAHRSDSDDGIDFKPFFDMIVGVLFVLLILVAAQMFFSQWEGKALSARERATQARLEWAREINSLLEFTAQRLRAAGLAAIVDRGDVAVVVELDGTLAVAAERGPTIDQTRAGALAQAVAETLGCLLRQSRPLECPDLKRLRLGQLRIETRLSVAAPIGSLPADRYANLASHLLHAAMLQEVPQLLALTGSAGGPALQPASSIVYLPTQSPGSPASHGSAGDLALRFSFDTPAELLR